MTPDRQTEADLCAKFRAWAQDRGWIVHPEVSDWDFVMVPGPGLVGKRANGIGKARGEEDVWHADDQLGVQAKLSPNIEVLYQAISALTGPRYRMVVVPQAAPPFLTVAEELGLAVGLQRVQRRFFTRKVWEAVPAGFVVKGWVKRRGAPGQPQLVLPPIVTDLVAGGPCPRQLTPWRIKAFKLCKLVREQGFVTTADFKRLDLDWKRWDGTWLVRDGVLPPRTGSSRAIIRFVPHPTTPLPDVGWEDIIQRLDQQAATT